MTENEKKKRIAEIKMRQAQLEADKRAVRFGVKPSTPQEIDAARKFLFQKREKPPKRVLTKEERDRLIALGLNPDEEFDD
jgi:hypothetical protein